MGGARYEAALEGGRWGVAEIVQSVPSLQQRDDLYRAAVALLLVSRATNLDLL